MWLPHFWPCCHCWHSTNWGSLRTILTYNDQPCFWFLQREFWHFYSGSPRFDRRYRWSRAYSVLNLLVEPLCLLPPGDQILKMFVPLATQLHEQRKVYLNKLILCGIYKSLWISSRQILDSPCFNTIQIGGPIWLLQMWLNATFVPNLCSENLPSTVVGSKGV